MRNEKSFSVSRSYGQKGAALISVLMATLLLGTACIAMLSAVGASSKNNTDALSETKAYYAAESGLQATINVLRNTSNMTYSAALDQQTAGTFPVAANVGSETRYTIQISDPDNSRASTTYTSAGFFSVTTAGPWEATKYFPDSASADRTELTYVPPTGAPVAFAHPDTAPYPELGSFRVTKVGNGGTITQVLFRIDYQMLDPRPDTRSIRGTIVIGGAGPEIDYDFNSYQLSGGTIEMCPTDQCVTSGTEFTIPLNVPATGSEVTYNYARIGPVDPYRLRVLSTGYGPSGAVKQLEGIIQKNFFNDSAGGPPLQMMGPNANFQAGPSSRMTISGGSSPSVGVCDATGLNTVNTTHTNGTMSPPPAMTCNETPSWLASPIALDAVIRQLRQSAINSGRYFANTSPTNQQGWGDFNLGTGITFCDGNCELGGNNEGGGILVVTGTLSTSGNPRFKGLVLVVGSGGIVRSGGGNEEFIGNIVVAPYNPNNLTATWTMSPTYDQRGGPGALINSDLAVDDAFNGTGAINNFMLGIAEK